jgi:hypothetical protein
VGRLDGILVGSSDGNVDGTAVVGTKVGIDGANVGESEGNDVNSDDSLT